eukprot:3836881-Rhodomonas_salina.3
MLCGSDGAFGYLGMAVSDVDLYEQTPDGKFSIKVIASKGTVDFNTRFCLWAFRGFVVWEFRELGVQGFRDDQ